MLRCYTQQALIGRPVAKCGLIDEQGDVQGSAINGDKRECLSGPGLLFAFALKSSSAPSSL